MRQLTLRSDFACYRPDFGALSAARQNDPSTGFFYRKRVVYPFGEKILKVWRGPWHVGFSQRDPASITAFQCGVLLFTAGRRSARRIPAITRPKPNSTAAGTTQYPTNACHR